MRIIKRARRSLIISPSGVPIEEQEVERKPATRRDATAVLRFDQLPPGLQRVLSPQSPDMPQRHN